jgi:cytochrome c5
MIRGGGIMTRRALEGRIAGLVLVALLVHGCGHETTRDGPKEGEEFLVQVDTLLSELGGRATASLDRGQRWRMVSSMGSGLPPPNFDLGNLPEPEARGAKLLGAYCVQCHSLPAPQMHAAAEWPILMRRMIMRAQTLHDRMGGPMTRGILGQVLLSGMASAQIPTVEDADSITVYLQRHAMPVARPEELGTGPEREFFTSRCGFCHETPSPSAHLAAEWPQVVARMQANMAIMSVRPLSEEESRRVLQYLEERSSP